MTGVVVVGGGIVGLATARQLLVRHPSLAVTVLEKELDLATHQTARNSGVMHAGLYYPPGSRKALLCRDGKAALERYAADRGIPFERCGKVVVAVRPDELARFDSLHRRAQENGIPGLEVLGPDGLRDREPNAVGLRALWSPSTGIIDFRQVALAFADDVRSRGGRIELGVKVTDVARRPDRAVVVASTGEYEATGVITCAGVYADRVGVSVDIADRVGVSVDIADRVGVSVDIAEDRSMIVPFRGDYYTLTPEAAPLVRGLIYPVPDPDLPFLGVHLTRRVDGSVLAGPNAVLALAREGYRRRDLDARHVLSMVTDRRFWRLARRYWRTGAIEVWRDVSRRAFTRQLRQYVPALAPDDLRWAPAGIRAQAVDPDGHLVDDFRFGGGARVLTVRNAPSPAATSSLALAMVLVNEAEERWLGGAAGG